MDEAEVIVLLVDDQPIVVEAVRRAIANEPNVQFHYCSNGAAAVETAERLRPTIILQDLVMPDIDGLALVRNYRENPVTKGIPVVVLSAKEDPASKSASFASGANDYLVKLPDRVELIARIRYHSRAFSSQMQRDQAYRALHESQRILVEKNLELERFSHVDGLTGISNRRYFDQFSTMQWKQAMREFSGFSILMIDVDNFKSYNDNYGHLAGDVALVTVATALTASCRRPTDLVARFGGEEFIASLETDLGGASIVGENLREAVERAGIDHGGVALTVSVGGAATTPSRADSLVELIRSADAALYEAKAGGKNRVVVRAHAAPMQAAASEEPRR